MQTLGNEGHYTYAVENLQAEAGHVYLGSPEGTGEGGKPSGMWHVLSEGVDCNGHLTWHC